MGAPAGSPQRFHLVLADADARVIGRRQRLQIESRPPSAKRHPVGAAVDVEEGILGQRAQQILQLARADRDGLAFLARQRAVRGDLHFEIRRRHKQPSVFLLDENIGEYRQRLPALDDARNRLQRLQQCVSWYLL